MRNPRTPTGDWPPLAATREKAWAAKKIQHSQTNKQTNKTPLCPTVNTLLWVSHSLEVYISGFQPKAQEPLGDYAIIKVGGGEVELANAPMSKYCLQIEYVKTQLLPCWKAWESVCLIFHIVQSHAVWQLHIISPVSHGIDGSLPVKCALITLSQNCCQYPYRIHRTCKEAYGQYSFINICELLQGLKRRWCLINPQSCVMISLDIYMTERCFRSCNFKDLIYVLSCL